MYMLYSKYTTYNTYTKMFEGFTCDKAERIRFIQLMYRCTIAFVTYQFQHFL